MPGRSVAVIGAGVVGCALAFELARRGASVLLLDRHAPATGGASFGNVGHIAAELVEPLPSPALLRNFWRELTLFGGPLAMPPRRWLALAPWAWAFARAAFRRPQHTALLMPLVRPATAAWAALLEAAGRPELLRRHGHYQFWQGHKGARLAQAEATHMAALGVPTAPAPSELLAELLGHTGETLGAALHFPDCAHVLDPAQVAMALAEVAVQSHGARFELTEVQSVQPSGDGVVVQGTGQTCRVDAAVVCAGAWSAPLLTPFGLRVPLEAAFGYHVELPAHPPLVDAPILYDRQRLLVTPMAGRLRASTFMEFSGVDSVPDPAKYLRLRQLLRQTGYDVPELSPQWRGPRPVLPDYLPGLGQVAGIPVWYALGHQHIGLTLAPVTAEMLADAVMGRRPRLDLAAFDLRRFGRGRSQ